MVNPQQQLYIKSWNLLIVQGQSPADPIYMLETKYKNPTEYQLWRVKNTDIDIYLNLGADIKVMRYPWVPCSRFVDLDNCIRLYLTCEILTIAWESKKMEFDRLLRRIRERRSRLWTILGYRRSFQAWRDRSRIFIPAREGRPMELRVRLGWGKKAGGLTLKGNCDGKLMSPLEAARKREHEECIKMLEDASVIVTKKDSKCCVIC